MAILIMLGFLIIVLFVVYVVINIPVYIAQARGLRDEDVQTVKLLSWLSLLIGVTWFAALVMALVYQPQGRVSSDKEKKNIDLDALEKLYQLKEKGVLSQEEYDREKGKIMGSLN